MKRKIMFTAAILSAALLCSCSQNAPDSKQQALINEIVSDAKSVTLATEKPAEEAAAAPERETTTSATA